MKVYLLFGAVLLVLFTIIIIPPIYDRVVEPLNSFLASSSATAITFLGSDNVVSEGKSVTTAGFAINIAEGCNGIYALSIILAGILAFPSGWRAKLMGVMIATVFIMFLNYVRILTLWYAGLSSSFLFDAMHLYVWEFIIIALGAGLWYFWYERYAQKH
jgi:exosortase H (IPTLxxWG-CTERM-specific)